MPDIIDLSQDILPDPTLIDALRSEHSPAEALKLLARLRDRVKENRRGLKRQADRFDQAYEEAAHSGLALGVLCNWPRRFSRAREGLQRDFIRG
jgi:hypothetical protein